MLLVASETGHVYTFATPKLQPMITSETGKALIQTCLHQPDPPNVIGVIANDYDMRMSANGYEETELGYQVPEEDFKVNGLQLYIASFADILSPIQRVLRFTQLTTLSLIPRATSMTHA